MPVRYWVLIPAGARCSSVVQCLLMNGSSDQSLMVDLLSYLLFQPLLHDWYKGCGMTYPVCGMVYIKDPLLLIEKSSSCSGGSRFPLSLSELNFTICLTSYNVNKKCVHCVIK